MLENWNSYYVQHLCALMVDFMSGIKFSKGKMIKVKMFLSTPKISITESRVRIQPH